VALFAYTARSREGLYLEDRLEASSAEAVATQLAHQGISPIKILPVRAPADFVAALRARFVEERVPLEELIAFCRQMHALARAGIPILRAMSGLAENARNQTLGRALADVSESLKNGRELSASFQRHPRIFPLLFASVIQVGENTGRLDASFEQLIRYLELERETRRRIATATRYPTLVVGAVAVALVVINIFVVPVFSSTLASFGVALPWPTRLMIATSNLFVRLWPWLLLGSVLAVALCRRWAASPAGRLTWDRVKLRTLVFGPILRRATLARFARAFAMTFASGLPILRALEVAARSSDNAWIEERVRGMAAQIERGETLTRAAASAGLFEPLFLQMLSVGEETGALAEMHLDIAVAYEAEVDYDLRRLSELLEPMLIVAVGGVVLLLALAVYLPLWSLSSGIHNGG
jgi:MSHA biogenesis protein MshG